jgi:hypothetical protein
MAAKAETDAFEKGFALGRQEVHSRDAALRRCVELVNEHTILMQALMKKLGTNPDELLKLLDQGDFINDADVPKEGTVLS